MDPRDEIFYSTAPITVATNDGGRGYGTGVFFRFCEQHFGQPVPALVTNKHVLESALTVSFPLNLGDAGGVPRPGAFEMMSASIDQCLVADHPVADIDLCAILLGPFITGIKRNSGQQTGLLCATPDTFATEAEIASLRPLDTVVMIGYPLGLWDHQNNQPVSRRGALATRPTLDFQGRPEFLIDMACYPGSSGSPVFMYDVNFYLEEKSAVFGKGRLRLLGVLYAGPMYDAEGRLHADPIPTSGQTFTAEVPVHLGYVIKAKELLELEGAVQHLVESSG